MTDRVASFEQIISSSLDVLDHPSVVTALAASAFSSEEIMGVRHSLETAFLPNVQEGLVIAPSQYRDTDNIPIVPLDRLEARKGIMIDPSMYWLTSRRRSAIAEAVASRYQDATDIDRRHTAVVIGDRSLEALRNSKSPLIRLGDMATCALIQVYESDFLVEARPVVFEKIKPPFRYLQKHSRKVVTAAATIHEVMHAWDSEMREAIHTDNKEDPLVARTRNESRGYHLTYLIMSAMGVVDPYVRAVETLRSRYNADNDPFATPNELVEAYKRYDVIS